MGLMVRVPFHVWRHWGLQRLKSLILPLPDDSQQPLSFRRPVMRGFPNHQRHFILPPRPPSLSP